MLSFENTSAKFGFITFRDLNYFERLLLEKAQVVHTINRYDFSMNITWIEFLHQDYPDTEDHGRSPPLASNAVHILTAQV